MSLPTKAKVVIIGGGIHGLSTAWKLSETYKNPGDIVILEKKDTAAGASGIACGVIRNNYFQPAMRELMAHSVSVWESDPKAWKYNAVGYLQISPEVMHEDVASIYEQQKAIGYDSEFIEGEKECTKYMKGMFDDWQAQGITSVLHEKKGGYAFNKDSVKALESKSVTNGVNIIKGENLYYFGTYDVDFNKRTELDVKDMTAPEANKEIDNLMSQGYGTIVIKNPQGKHSLGVGILNKLNLIFEGSLGYFGMGSCDGPTVRINGRVGWSCAENLMAGKVVIEKNAGSCFGAAIRGGDLICKGSVGARTGIDMKGGTIIVGGDAGAFTGFMMQRGRIIILGDVGINLGDSMYDGTIFIGGKIGSFGSDAVPSDLTDTDKDWLKRKLKVAEIGEKFDVSKMTKIVAGKKLWNYDNLEPTEKKGAI